MTGWVTAEWYYRYPRRFVAVDNLALVYQFGVSFEFCAQLFLAFALLILIPPPVSKASCFDPVRLTRVVLLLLV